MDRITSPGEMTAWSDRRRGARIGLVPTMGFLHAGHASLMDLLRPRVDHLVVSVFVNPLQFAPTEDLDRYPRDPEGDRRLCEAHGVDAVFVPGAREGASGMYPAGFQTSVSVHELTTVLDGAVRPGHFEGVTTVVARLFGLTRCDLAAFGEKDYQQLAVIRRMVDDLGMPVEIVPGPLVRDADGLALSSRNTYLSPAERARGLSLHRALFAMRDARAAGASEAAEILAAGHAALDVDRLDYLALVDPRSLAPLDVVDGPARALVAAFVGRTRLIDNVAV